MNKLLILTRVLIALSTAHAQSVKAGEDSKFIGTIDIGGDVVSIVIESKSFVRSKHVQDVENWEIDGKRPIGVDGHEVNPKEQIESMSLTWNGKRIDIPESFYNDIYSPTLKVAKLGPLEKGEGILLLPDKDSDSIMIRMRSFKWASAPYCVYWVLSKNGSRMRFVQPLDF